MMIWEQLWYHINDQQITSLDFIDFAVAQLPHETSELSVKTALTNLGAAVLYSPTSMVRQKNSEVFKALNSLMQKTEHTEIKSSIMDNIMNFAYENQDLETSVEWLDKKEMSTTGKSKVLLAVCRSSLYTEQQKQELVDKVIPPTQKDDDISIETKMACRSAKPDPAIKKDVWTSLTTNDKGISKEQLTTMMGSFYQFDQEAILMPYYDDYYNVLSNKNFYTTKGYRYLDDFVHGMLPRRKNIKQEDINKLKMVKENLVKDDPQVSKGYLNLI